MPIRDNPQKSAILRIGPRRLVARLWRILLTNIAAPAGKPGRLVSGHRLRRRRFRRAVVQRPPEAFKSHEGFLALSFVEADRADRMVEQRLQLCFVREPGRFHIVVLFVRGCVYGRWKGDGPQSTPQGPQRERRSFTLATQTGAKTAERTEQDEDG